MEMMKTADHKYSRWKDLAWRLINGVMGTFFLIAALLQVSDIIFYPCTKNLEEFNRNCKNSSQTTSCFDICTNTVKLFSAG